LWMKVLFGSWIRAGLSIKFIANKRKRQWQRSAREPAAWLQTR
jgi:hypothetical protein